MIQNVSFEIPLKFIKGLKNGTFERYGGIVRDSASKKVRGWLKEVPSENGMNSQVTSQLSSISSSLQFTNALQIANIGVSIAGFAMLAIKLNKISKQIVELAEQFKEVKEITLMNQKINLFQTVSNYEHFENQLRDYLKAKNKNTHKSILNQAYNDLCRNNIVIINLLKDENSLKSLSIQGIEMISSLHQFICLSYRSQVTYNMLFEEIQIAKGQLQGAAENLFIINKNLVKAHSNLGWTGRVLHPEERQKLEDLLNTSIEVENLFESKVIYLNTVKEPEKIDLSTNYQLAFIEVA
jgi:hypothetical protein